MLKQCQLFIWGGKRRLFALAKKNEIARLAKSLLERLFKGNCALTEEMKGEGVDVFVEYSDIKSETDLKSELAKAISISTTKPKSGQASSIFSLLKKEMILYEKTCIPTPNFLLFYYYYYY
jgi:hypothetical protein